MSLSICTGTKEHDLTGYPNAKFCPHCGCKTAQRRCEECDYLLNEEQRFCENCGYDTRESQNATEAGGDDGSTNAA